MSTPHVLCFEFPGLPKVRCAFQTRQGGFSAPPFNAGNISLTVGDDPVAVIKNRKALLKTLGVPAWSEEIKSTATASSSTPRPPPWKKKEAPRPTA